LHGLVKPFSGTLTGFLRIQTSEFEMPTMELNVFQEKLRNFDVGRFLSSIWKFWQRAGKLIQP
jgi:hypothetical protein